ncbi:carbamoyltransferase HypF [Actinotalea sp. M2MS4P-6]|uniref:carbamoyltransferase HypF n=1 Tax=Actinotalea sp. M2MS4P-6 TaxID=2983762 RepID=UPI0021E38DC5|nr:carbamoyltransferase HypF [Actinotalea sp. M2MS4P-6]MCV2395871.1 carbamoyltransferase HypF [Actinotalea sp. M2MS4P-6]
MTRATTTGGAPDGTVARATATAGVLVVVDGVVQGVGFRPFVWRLATELGLSGRVANVAGRVEIEAAGRPEALGELTRRLAEDAPPRARVDAVRASEMDDPDWVASRPDPFVIEASRGAEVAERHFPPDLATCPACLTDLTDPDDRRFGYPFTNCTDCGPRATIIDDLPYDRAATTMADFGMCDACAAEYTDPADRRFHAEPVACPRCGPQPLYRAGARTVTVADGDPIAAAAADLAAGVIVAVKGLGGYHLACDATDETVVARLRDRKHRWAKPFAVMVPTLASATELAHVDADEATLLTGPRAPIVLLRPSGRANLLAPSVLRGATDVGVLLPYTPLHHLLMAAVDRPLVLTSGNVADEPLATDDEEAATRLADIADAFLVHDRRIRARYDDSVTRVDRGRERMLRRGRGYAPEALPLPIATPRALLAVGAELKHTFTLARGGSAHVAPHNGDLEDLRTHEAFTDGLAHLSTLLALEPEVVVHDLHPEYLSTKYALRTAPAERRLAVQHHHAHVASCAAEHGVTGRFLGVAYDGLGMGDDGTLWGGELMLADLRGYRRLARFARAPLPGGALAVHRPYRMALGYLLGGERLDADQHAGQPADQPGDLIDPDLVAPFLGRLDPREVATIRTQVSRGLNAPLASSAGRLFDAAAALLGLRDVVEYEAQAAIDLERAAGDLPGALLPYRLERADGLLVYDPLPTLAALLGGSAAGESTESLAAALHETVVEVTREMLAEVRADVDVVCLSGGVLQNRRLSTSLLDRLGSDGFQVHLNEQVPCNDGGISYGQAAVAAAQMAGDPAAWASTLATSKEV